MAKHGLWVHCFLPQASDKGAEELSVGSRLTLQGACCCKILPKGENISSPLGVNRCSILIKLLRTKWIFQNTNTRSGQDFNYV